MAAKGYYYEILTKQLDEEKAVEYR